MMAAILNCAILDSAILVFLSNLLTLAKIGSHHLHKKNFTHSFWFDLMMAAILNSDMMDSDTAILDSDTLLFSLTFIEKHSHSTLTLTQTNSIWLNLIHSDSTWWWQPSWIMPSWIKPFCTKNFTHSFWLDLMMAAILNSSHIGFSHFTKTLVQTNSIWLKLIHSDSTWWWQPSWIVASWIQPS